MRRAVLLVLWRSSLALALAPAGCDRAAQLVHDAGVRGRVRSGSLLAWDGLLGNGSATVLPTAAHTGGFGLELSNGPQQFQVAVKAMPSPLVDSSTSFWVKIAAGTGFQMVAQARDSASSAHMWDLAYDGGQHTFYFFPYSATGSTEIATGAGTAPSDTWIHVEIQYTATATGGARIYFNDQTQSNWAVAGDYTRSSNLARIQLWNDGPNTTDFDDVYVGTPAQAATVPGAPTGVAGIAGDQSVALSWTAPSSDGGSPITGYRITPYIGANAQTPVLTGSPERDSPSAASRTALRTRSGWPRSTRLGRARTRRRRRPSHRRRAIRTSSSRTASSPATRARGAACSETGRRR